MTAAASAATPNKSKLGRYILYRFERTKYFTLLMCVFSFISYPLYLLFTRRYVEEMIRSEMMMSGIETRDAVYRASETLSGIGNALLFVGILGIGAMTALSVFINFRYIFGKKYVNMDMSLPLSFNERFFGDIIVSSVTTFVPHILGVIAGTLISAGIRAIKVPEGVEVLSNTAFLDGTERIMHIGIVVVFMEFFSLLFVGSLCGRVIPTLVHWAILNCTVPAVTYLHSMLSMLTAYGCSETYIMYTPNIVLFEVTSPLGFALFFRRERDPFGAPLELSLAAVFVLLLAVGSYLLMKHRRAERTGESYVFKYSRHILVGAHLAALAIYFICPLILGDGRVNYLILYPDYYNSDFYNSLIVWWIVISAVVFFIGEVSDSARFRNMLRSAVCALISVCAGALICLIAVISDGYGAVTYIPAEEDTAVVSVTLTNSFDRLSSYDIPYSQVAELHRKILDTRPGGSGKRMITSEPGVNIEYIENNGSMTYRSYIVDDALAKEALELLWNNGAFESLYKIECVHGVNVTGNEYKFLNDFTPTKIRYYNDSEPWSSEDERTVKIDVPGDELMAAMQRDARETTFEQLYRSPCGLYDYIGVDFMGSLYDTQVSFKIYPFFKHTLELLSAHGFDLSEYMLEVTDAFLIMTDDPINKVEDENSTQFDSALKDGEEHIYSRSYRHVNINSAEYEQLSAMSADRSIYYGNDPHYCMIYIRKYYQHGTVYYRTTYQPVPELCTADAAALWDKLQPAAEEDVNYYRQNEYIEEYYVGE